MKVLATYNTGDKVTLRYVRDDGRGGNTTLNCKCVVVKDNKVTVDVEDVKTGEVVRYDKRGELGVSLIKR